MNASAEQINIVLDYQLTRIKQLEEELKTEKEQKEQAKRSEGYMRTYLNEAYADLKQVNKELLQTKKALRMLIDSINVEKTHEQISNG